MKNFAKKSQKNLEDKKKSVSLQPHLRNNGGSDESSLTSLRKDNEVKLKEIISL